MAQESALGRRGALGLAAGSLLSVAPSRAHAQAFPSRPLRFFSTGTPGSVSDIIPRVLSAEFERGLGQSVVVENRPGGSGLVGASAALAAPADGYSLFLGSIGTMTINPYVIPRMPFDSARDWIGIGLVAAMPLVVVVNPTATPVRDFAGLVALARQRPGEISYGSVGAGSTSNILAAMLMRDAGINLIHVPYAGFSQAIAEIIAGRLTFMFADFGTAIGQIQNGSLRPLAVSTEQRSRLLRDVPTMKDLGYDHDVTLWYGVYVRSGVPADIIRRLTVETQRAATQPSVRERFANLGLEGGNLYGEEFQAFHLAELERWRRLIPALGIQVPS
jgi:tripartite-type tricarboxylate transporter receptor subunit TctC